ncbi:MAG TPA: SPFH domain-containing protein [Burkholderiaceae bacterium]
MWQQRFKAWLDSIRARFAQRRKRTTRDDVEAYESRYETIVVDQDGRFDPRRWAVPATIAAIAVVSAIALVTHPPLQSIGRGEVGVRINHLTGTVSEWSEGSVLVVPGLQRMRVFSLRDRSWRATPMSRADGPAPLQSVEGLSLGADLTVRYAIDPLKVAALAKSLPDDVGTEIVEPAAQGVIYKVFARYTVREIFSSKRSEIQAAVENELKPKLAADGVVLRSVQVGKIDLPADYKRGMESLLAEELAGEKMKYTLDLKAKQVRETELTAQSEKVRREIGAEAAAREQVIAAKGQEEAMKHVLPFKQRQIEQRQLEAEALKVTRIKAAEASAQARRIEANGEAEARQKLADAEVYRMDKVGKSNAEQMGREGALLTRHPLLIQKTMADKLSDKVQVIIAPTPAAGQFIGSNLVGARSSTSPGETESR